MTDRCRFVVSKRGNYWQLVLSYKDAQGKWHKKSKSGYTRKSEASSEEEKQKLLASIPSSDIADVSMLSMTLAQFLEVFKRDQQHALAYNTLKNYDIALSRVPSIRDKVMVEITYADVLHAVRSIPLKASSVNLTIQKLKALFTFATEVYHLFPVSPIAHLPSEKERRSGKVKALTADELADLLEDMREEGPIPYAVCCIAGYAGLRFGEICGLTRPDIDLMNMTIHVGKQWGLVSHGRYNFKTPKSNNGFRDVPIPPRLAAILSDYLQSRKVYDLHGRLFPLNASAYLNARIKHHNPTCSIHQLRHTYATMILANGVDVKTVSALIGDKVETVIKTYVHYNDDMRKAAKESVLRIFG